MGLVALHFPDDPVAMDPDVHFVGVGPFTCNLKGEGVLAHAEAVRVGNDTQEVPAAFGRDEHISV
jgi:hypothetical protein